MDGLFELLIILAIFLFPAIEAWARRRRREPGGPEEGGAGDPGTEPGRPTGRRGSGDERRSAGDLLPEDLWAELTGERRTAGADARGADAGGAATAEGAPAELEEPERFRWRSADREGREREARDWEAGEWEAEPAPGAGADPEAGPPRTDPAAEGPPEGLGPEVGGFPRAEEPGREPVAGEIGAGRGCRARRSRASELQRIRPGRMARRGGEPAHARPAHPLVGELDRDALRRAVVYREILGPPVSMRED